MTGEAMSAFIPIHLGANERSQVQDLVPWIRSCSTGPETMLLDKNAGFSSRGTISKDGSCEPMGSRSLC